MSDTFQTRAVVLGAPELVFRSFNHWVAKAREMYEQTGLLESDLVALDTRGRVCRRGAHFKRAHDEDAYPVIVYRAEPGATQGEAMVYAMHAGGCHDRCPFLGQNFEDEWCGHPRAPLSSQRFYLPVVGAPEWCPRRGMETVVTALEQGVADGD